jgi:hypothetical protein
MVKISVEDAAIPLACVAHAELTVKHLFGEAHLAQPNLLIQFALESRTPYQT